MFSHITKKSKQRCYKAVWWPTRESTAGSREKRWPLMVFESGQINRVNINNLVPYIPGK